MNIVKIVLFISLNTCFKYPQHMLRFLSIHILSKHTLSKGMLSRINTEAHKCKCMPLFLFQILAFFSVKHLEYAAKN